MLCGCGSGTQGRKGDDPVTAMFRDGFTRPVIDATGKRIGTVSGMHGGAGLTVSVEVSGLAPGEHGLHLHEVGRCDPPDSASAGAPWTTQGRKHGHDNPDGPHDGDLGNLDVGADGTGRTDRLIPRYHAKIPATGLALVIHADEDDEKTDPSGNSGARVACGVVLPPV